MARVRRGAWMLALGASVAVSAAAVVVACDSSYAVPAAPGGDATDAMGSGDGGATDAGALGTDANAAADAACANGKVACATSDSAGVVCTNVSSDDNNCGQCGHVCNFPGCMNGECIRAVFVTSTTTTGNMGGITGADALCQARASAGKLHGTFFAWLSTSTTSPAQRFKQSLRPYQLAHTSTVVAQSFGSLITTFVQVPIKSDENGMLVSGMQTWTDTTPAGLLDDASRSCTDWTSSNGNSGFCGGLSQTGASWTQNNMAPCPQSLPLYCFEQ